MIPLEAVSEPDVGDSLIQSITLIKGEELDLNVSWVVRY